MSIEIDSPLYWDERYKNNEANWDLKSANPVFVELMEKAGLMSPGKLFIPGCGKGFDAVEAARRGYEVTALDFSVEAVKFARSMAEKEKLKVNFLTADFFNLNGSYENYFDYIYEYTTYCAIDPARRAEFAGKMASMLKPGGMLVTVLFPVEDRPGGPPFGIDPVDTFKIFSKYLKLSYSTKDVNSIKPRKDREFIQLYIK